MNHTLRPASQSLEQSDAFRRRTAEPLDMPPTSSPQTGETLETWETKN